MIEVDIKKSYPNFNLDVAFRLEKGVLTLFGPSGSGKSTTFQCISGLFKPDSGYISLNGRVLFDSTKRINLPPKDRKIGYIFQNYALFPHMTVRNNIAFGIKSVDKKKANNKINDLLHMMRLDGLGDRYPWQLSGGQQQRVALARVLAMEPELLLMDEPFSALDSNLKDELEREILELQKYYQGDIILITHNLAEAYKLSSKIAVYQSGSIVQYALRDELINNPINSEVAGLTGVKNILKGSVVKTEVDKIFVQTQFGLVVVSPSCIMKFYSGQEVFIGIRPEDIKLTNANIESLNVVECKLVKSFNVLSGCQCIFVSASGLEPGCVLHVNTAERNITQHNQEQKWYLYLLPDRIAVMAE